MTLREFVERADRKACEIFAKTGQVLPIYHIIDGNDRDVLVPAPRTGGKTLEAAMIRALMEAIEAKRFVCIQEIWMLEMSAMSDAEAKAMSERANREGVSNLPGRIEAISISAEDVEEPMIMAWREIIRPERGRAKLGDLVIMPPDGAEGRFVGMLPKKGRTH
jgi:hypothetical protein